MKHLVTVTWTCWNCEKETEVEVQPFVPAVTSGPSDRWQSAEGGDFEPGVCEHCKATIDGDSVWELVTAREEDLRDRAAELRYGRRRDEYLE